MRKRLVLAGGIVLLLGLVLLVTGSVLTTVSSTQVIPAGKGLAIKSVALSAQTAKINWTRATSSTAVYLVTGTPSCTSPSDAGIVGNATGATRSFSVTVQPGKAYNLYGCSGTKYVSVVVTYTVSGGLSALELLAIFVVVVGFVVLVLGLRRTQDDYARTYRSPPARWGPSPEDELVPRATPASVLRPRGNAVKECPRCGRVFGAASHTTCPACDTQL